MKEYPLPFILIFYIPETRFTGRFEIGGENVTQNPNMPSAAIFEVGSDDKKKLDFGEIRTHDSRATNSPTT